MIKSSFKGVEEAQISQQAAGSTRKKINKWIFVIFSNWLRDWEMWLGTVIRDWEASLGSQGSENMVKKLRRSGITIIDGDSFKITLIQLFLSWLLIFVEVLYY